MNENDRDSEELNTGVEQEAALAPQGEGDGLIRIECEELDVVPLESKDHSLAIPSGCSGFKARLDALIPLLGNVAAAVPGKDAAIVRFPVVDGKQLGWNDLLNRKTPGWEEWKQLGGFNKDVKFNPQAAIKKAGLKSNPAAVANLALQGAAIVVGQAYMAEINSKLEGIENGIATIERMLERDKEAELRSCTSCRQMIRWMGCSHQLQTSTSEMTEHPRNTDRGSSGTSFICLLNTSSE